MISMSRLSTRSPRERLVLFASVLLVWLLALAPAGVLAGPIDALLGVSPALPFEGSVSTTMTISALTLRVKYGGLVTVRGSLRSSGGTLLPGMAAALQRSYDGSTWTTVTVPVSPTGSYSAVVAVYRQTHFRWVCPGAADVASCTSAEMVVSSYASVGAPNVALRVRPGRSYSCVGSLKPRHAEGTYVIKMQWQVYTRGAWRSGGALLPLKVRNYSNYSRYGYVDRYIKGVPRGWRVRAIHADADHLRTNSAWKYYSVY
jgi:hypothetical protein